MRRRQPRRPNTRLDRDGLARLLTVAASETEGVSLLPRIFEAAQQLALPPAQGGVRVIITDVSDPDWSQAPGEEDR